LQPINWESYNDVKTVYWNCYTYCKDRDIIDYHSGKQVKMYGWIFSAFDKYLDYGDFTLIDDSLLIHAPNPSNASQVRIQCFNSEELEGIKNKFETADLTSKCYVHGVLSLPCLHQMGCSKTRVEIFIESADDIYFGK
jgi:hypothetical protein